MKKITFTPLRYTEDGRIEVHIQRSTTEQTKTFTPDELEKEMQESRLYCRFKGYQFALDNTKWEVDANARNESI